MIFKKQPPQEDPHLVALRQREAELLEKQRALESEMLDTPDPRESNEILREINELNAKIGVLRAEIKEAQGN